jgi:two-component system OmpR family response regulator
MESTLLHSALPDSAPFLRSWPDARQRPWASVLLLTSDPDLRSLVETLGGRGLQVTAPTDLRTLEHTPADAGVDVILVDTETPAGDGLVLCRQLSIQRSPPVIFLAESREETDRVVALEIGADDCLPRGCSTRELLARIRALVRRAAVQRDSSPQAAPTRYGFCGWRLCLDSRELRAPGAPAIYLAASELALLRALVEHPREVLTRGQLHALLGEEGAASSRLVDWRVHRLRAKLDKAGGGAELIKTISGRGYLFDADVRPL